MSEREWQIGICGTFDVENYGDLLFSLIAEAELRQRLGPVKTHRFSYRPKALPDWPYAVTSLAELPEAASNLDGMMIGGGALVRFDKAVAPDYGPLTPDIHHPTGYWLTPIFIASQYNCPVVWNALGVEGEIPAWAEPLLGLAINLSDYVAVRDEPSRLALAPYAQTVEIKVVPDTAFGLPNLINIKRPSNAYTNLCETLRLNRPYIIVQATEGLKAFCQLVRDQPQIFDTYQLVVLPIGPILGDDAQALSAELPGSICPPNWPDPLVIAELIGHAEAVVGTSLHLAITALAFGVPVFRPAENFRGKYATLLNFDTVIPFKSGAEIDPQVFVGKIGRSEPSPLAVEALSRLSKHWDDIALVLRSERSSDSPIALGRFWQSLPNQLETEAVRSNAALAEREAVRTEREAVLSKLDAMYNSTSWKITRPLRALGRKLGWHKSEANHD
jgi:lipopolysaccharide transport system ATP-binding protein